MRLGILNAAPDKPRDLNVYLLTKDGRVDSINYCTVKLPANVNLMFFVKPKFFSISTRQCLTAKCARKTTVRCLPNTSKARAGTTPVSPTP